MSETGPLLTLAHFKAHHLTGNPDDEVEIRTRAGLAVPLVDLRIVDSEMKEIARDGKATGEIVARAPWLTQGYLRTPTHRSSFGRADTCTPTTLGTSVPTAMSRSPIASEHIETRAASWVSSLELEDIISQHDGVSDVAVIGIKDEMGRAAIALRHP